MATRVAGRRPGRAAAFPTGEKGAGVVQAAPMRRAAILLAAFMAAGCGGEAGGAGEAPDAAAPPDADLADAPRPDAGALPLDGFGDLGGDCDMLDDELTSAQPSLFSSAIDFAAPFTDGDAGLLTEGGRAILAAGNAGGSSLYSEIFAFELLARCELAPLRKTETEVAYDQPGAITDLLVDIDGEKIGVSVTRAVGFPFDEPYTVEQAAELLERKLADVQESSAHVSAADRWRKQILAVVAYGPGHTDSLTAALEAISPEVRADTIVWILVTDGADHFIYCDGPCTG